MPYKCPTCLGEYRDILDHIRKNHPHEAYTDLTLQPLGLSSCPDCGTACRGQHGIKTHGAKVHGTIGTSRTSTLPRRRTGTSVAPIRAGSTRVTGRLRGNSTPEPPSDLEGPGDLSRPSSPESPTRPEIQVLIGTPQRYPEASQRPLQRKRPARTPSPSEERPYNRRRRNSLGSLSPSISPSFQRAMEEEYSTLEGLQGSRRPISPTPRRFSVGSDASDSSLPSIRSLMGNSPIQSVVELEEAAMTARPAQQPPPTSRPPSPTLQHTQPSQPPEQHTLQGQEPSISDLEDLSSFEEGPLTNREAPSPSQPLPSTEDPFSPTLQPQEPSQRDQHREITKKLLNKPYLQQLVDYSSIKVPEKRLHARQAGLFIGAAKRAADDFLKRPTEKALFKILALPRVLGLALQQGKVGKILREFPANLPEAPNRPEQPQGTKAPRTPTRPAEEARKILERGYIGKASQALNGHAPLAPDSAAYRATLREKHPIGERNPFLGKTSPNPGQAVRSEAIIEAISSINKEKAPGLSGWTRPLLDLAAREASFVGALRLLADMIRQGTAPGKDLLCAARLIGLQKPDKGIRPIAIGDLVYRVAAKALLITNYRPGMLLPNQLGVNSPGGTEPAIFLLEEAISGQNKTNYRSYTALDFQNAFNDLSRSALAAAIAKYAPTFYKAAAWAYNSPGLLITDSGFSLASAKGIRQGDPLGPFFFSLGIRPTLEALIKALPQATLCAYLDDLFILNREAQGTLKKASEVLQEAPIRLNLTKCKEVQIGDLQREGTEALGTFIGPLRGRLGFLVRKINSFQDTLCALGDLPKQHALLLLRGSIQLQLRHLLRQLNPIGLECEWERADFAVRKAIGYLISRDQLSPQELQPLQKDLIALPAREGGLGIPTQRELAWDTYKAAREASLPKIQEIRGPLGQEDPISQASRIPRTPEEGTPLTPKEVLVQATQARLQRVRDLLPTEKQRARLENSAYLGRKWLSILPTAKNLILADQEVTEAARNRLLLPIRTSTTPCNSCGNMASIGHEDTCKGASRRWISRHNQITRALKNALACRADLEVAEEPTVRVAYGQTSLLPWGIAAFSTTFKLWLSIRIQLGKTPIAPLRRQRRKRRGNTQD